jgi:hypothetical protein
MKQLRISSADRSTISRYLNRALAFVELNRLADAQKMIRNLRAELEHLGLHL